MQVICQIPQEQQNGLRVPIALSQNTSIRASDSPSSSPAVGMEGFEEQAYGKQGGEDENERDVSSGGGSGGGTCSSGPSSGDGQEEDVDEKDVLVLDSRNCEEKLVIVDACCTFTPSTH
jgi:hypothetical protein